MPEYPAPGAYVEEIEADIQRIEGVPTSTAGFIGLTERGPAGLPMLVTSLTDFLRIFGGYEEDSFLPYAVEGFFSNGGRRCFISRIVKRGSKTAEATIGNVTFTAIGSGIWGNRVAIRVENATKDPGDLADTGKKSFQLIIAYWREGLPDLGVPPDAGGRAKAWGELTGHAFMELFDNLSEDPESPDYYGRLLGPMHGHRSSLILLSGAGRPANTDGRKFFIPLSGGEDGPSLDPDDFIGNPEAKSGEKQGLAAFRERDEISVVYIPDTHLLSENDGRTLNDHLLSHCETLKDRFAIIDVFRGKKDAGAITIESVARPSRYGAVYYPWVQVFDPLLKRPELKPPGGSIAGIYARSDTERGVHKAPANEIVKGAMGLEFSITRGEQDILNPKGINVIRSFPGRGILVWGARTAAYEPLWKYVNIRRLFIFVEESIRRGTQWVVFEPNDEKLWARVRMTITQFLTQVWRDGALMGTKPGEAFFVKCDRTTMTQDDIDSGRLICVIGIAPVKPAEFVVFRIVQGQGGSSISE